MATLTIFANFFINDKERFQRLQDSFFSFKNISAEKWVINARGKYKYKTLAFLEDNLGDKIITYTMESKKGWFYDSTKMLENINTDFVLFWVEDHINLVNVEKYNAILNEMKESGSEYLCYSWWNFGKLREFYDKFIKNEHNNISTFILNEFTGDYIISMQGIFSLKLFKKLINKSMFLRNYTKFLPFSFEKRPDDLQWLPIRYALPKYELFASIDANLPDNDAYCLQARGMYPKRALREEAPKNTTNKKITRINGIKLSVLKKYIPAYILAKRERLHYYIRKYKRYINLIKKGQ